MAARPTHVRLAAGLVAVLATGGTTVAGAPAGAATPRPEVDLVFAIDTTGSMGPYLDQVRRSAGGITELLFAHADARVALVDYKDLHADCPADGYAARVDLPFTATAADLGPAVAGLAATGGCDHPESVYSGIMTGLALPWRPGARRALIVIGDAPPHEPERRTGYSQASVTAAATAAGVIVVPDPPATRTLRPAGAGSAVALYAVNINGGGSPFFEDLAADTGGKAYPATDPTGAVEQVAAAITDLTGGGLSADAGGPYVGAVGEPVTFTATTTGGSNRIGGYDWDFDGDGRYDVTTGDPTLTHTYRKPVTLTIRLRAHTDADPNEVATDSAHLRVLPRVRVKYTGQRSGVSGKRARLSGYVAGPRVKLNNVPVVFTLGDATCSAATNVDGRAYCEVITPPAVGSLPVTASADAGPDHLPGTTTEDYLIKEPRPTPTPTPTHS